MKIAIFGADGQLGKDLTIALEKHDVSEVPHSTADITDSTAVARELSRIKPRWVINSAAMTHVDNCETDELKAFEINAIGAGNIARACAAVEASLVYISTDYVFDGRQSRPYTESDQPNPLNVYGITKLAGEFYTRNALPSHYIVRTSGIYGHHPCRGKGRNFVETMLQLAQEKDSLRVVNDEILAPTFTVDLAEQIRALIDKAPTPGIYHATNSGECSWFEFAREIFQRLRVDIEVTGISAAEWKAPAKRPSYSVLENSALARENIDSMPDWRDGLERYFSGRDAS